MLAKAISHSSHFRVPAFNQIHDGKSNFFFFCFMKRSGKGEKKKRRRWNLQFSKEFYKWQVCEGNNQASDLEHSWNLIRNSTSSSYKWCWATDTVKKTYRYDITTQRKTNIAVSQSISSCEISSNPSATAILQWIQRTTNNSRKLDTTFRSNHIKFICD